MVPTRSLTLLLIFISASQASLFDFSIPFLVKSPLSPPKRHRVAIIGAGSAGSSAAYWISKAQSRKPENEIELEVFEKEGYIGGRSTVVYPYDSKAYLPVELGASIFVDANRNLMRAVDEFNLSLANYGEEDGEFGIWDGAEFRFRAMMTGGQFSWWDTLRLLWRYGMNSPQRAVELTQTMVSRFLELYNTTTPDWTNVSDISDFLEFTNLTAQTTEKYLLAQGIGARYINEMVESMTRVNYGQNVDSIHALEGLVSQAATGASSVAGGNYQIFEQFLRRSKAKIHLNTTVQTISKSGSKWILTTTKDGDTYAPFDSVILAAPYHSTEITVSPPLKSSIPPQPYVHLHVTLFTTSASHPNPSYFNLKNGSLVPITVLTTSDGYVHGGKNPEFNSLTYHGPAKLSENTTEPGVTVPEEDIVKIFSEKKIEDQWLKDLFGEVGWVYRKEWEAYPVLPPTTSFPPVMPDDNFYYVNSFEPFISTMETETISSLNAVRLFLRNTFGEDATSCDHPTTRSKTGEVMRGWDC